MKKVVYCFSTICVGLLGLLILKNPQVCTRSALNGLLLCGRVIIPALYPFTFCVLFIFNSGVLNSLQFADKLTKKLFGMPFSLFIVFLFSLIGGYPLGAKLINGTNADKHTRETMLKFCVNAGPAFIITAVGAGIFNSSQIGWLLFVCHIIPSCILLILSKKHLHFAKIKFQKSLCFTDNFVLSATSSAEALITICGFVVLFSIICAYINSFQNALPLLKPFSMLLEVTNGIGMTRNVFLISFILGFGGICIWCQIIAINKKAKPRILRFAFYRIIHGLSSAILTYLALKILNIPLPALSNGNNFSYSTFTSGAVVGISLIITGLTLIISLKNKNYAGNMLKDIV